MSEKTFTKFQGREGRRMNKTLTKEGTKVNPSFLWHRTLESKGVPYEGSSPSKQENAVSRTVHYLLGDNGRSKNPKPPR